MDLEKYREQEEDWASRLRGRSLVSEAGFDLRESLEAFRFVVISYRRQSELYSPEDRRRVLRRYPALLLAGLTGIGSSRYDEGRFWPKVEEELGIEITQVHRTEFSDAFRYGLEYFRLSRFDTPQRNIGEILMHAGVPVLSTGSLVHLLLAQNSKRTDLTGEGFCGWVGAMTRELAFAKGLDAPTWRFLKDGGAISSDFTERLLVFLDAVAMNRQDFRDEALRAFPRNVAEELDRLYRSGQFGVSSPRQRHRRHDLNPAIVYQDGLIQLGLPSMESPILGEHLWQFTTAGESWTRSLGSSWSHSRSVATNEPLPRPVTDIIVTYPLLDRDWRLTLVDREMPLLAFDFSSGRYVPSTHQLPQSWVWLAFPCDENTSPSDALEVDGALEIRERANTPTGWPGWAFLLVDLSNVKRLRPIGVTNRWRLISSIKRPTLRTPSEVPFIRSQTGTPIYGARPTLSLPAIPDVAVDSENAEWHIQTRDASGEIVASFSVRAGTDSVELDPWTELNDVLLGDYEIRAIGALGQSATFGVMLAEGLTVQATPSFRFINRHGTLEASRVRLQLDHRMQELRIESGEGSVEVTLDVGDKSMPIVVAPPHMWISAEGPDSSPRASTAPLFLEIERLPEMTLRLGMRPEEKGTLELLSGSSTLVEESLATGSSGVIRVPLARFYDSSRSVGGGELYVQWDGKISLIGHIRPKRLASSAMLNADTLLIERVYQNLELQVLLRVDNAPWLQIAPIRFPPGIDAVVLPDPALGRGPLTASVRPFDLWEVGLTPEQEASNRENQFRIESEFDGSFESLEDRFIRWVAGISPIPDGSQALAFALDVYGTLSRGRDPEDVAILFRDVATLSRAASVALLEAIPDSRWSQQTHTRLLAEGWPATAPRSLGPADPGIWRRSPFLGLLTLPGDLSEPESHWQLAEWLGEESVNILTTGNDPAETASAFNANVATLADKPQSVQDALWKAYTAVPGQVLTKDQRGIQARELFDHRGDFRLKNLIGVSPIIVDQATSLLECDIGKHSLHPLQARKAPKDWRQLPQVSLGLALVARLAARAVREASEMYDYAQHWYADLATCAPTFVEQDLILAELWLTRWENS